MWWNVRVEDLAIYLYFLLTRKVGFWWQNSAKSGEEDFKGFDNFSRVANSIFIVWSLT